MGVRSLRQNSYLMQSERGVDLGSRLSLVGVGRALRLGCLLLVSVSPVDRGDTETHLTSEKV